MNKGIEIRNKKRRKDAIKRNTIKPSQENICKFITIRYIVFSKLNGKYKKTGSKTLNGLQIKNRMYSIDGKYKLLNSHSVKIIKKFNKDIPDWASKELIDKYEKFLISDNKLEDDSD